MVGRNLLKVEHAGRLMAAGCVVLALLLACGRQAAMAEDRPEGSFEKAYAAVVTRRCLGCHGERKPKAGLNLGRRERVLSSDVEGEEPVVVARKPDKSRLIERVTDGSMPPEDDGPPLTPAEIAALRTWIEAGANWPAGRVLKGTDEAEAESAAPR